MPLVFSGGSALIETLQSSLKQRDGENDQLKWELSRLQAERNFLLSEVSTLTSQLEGVCSCEHNLTFYNIIVFFSTNFFNPFFIG